MKKLSVLLLASTMLAAFAAHAEDAAPASAAGGQDYVALKVNGEDVKKSQVDEAWKNIFQGREAPPMDSFGPQMKEKFLRELASEYTLYNEATKEGVDKSPEVEATMEKVKRQVVIGELLRQKTKDAVTDDKLKAAYDKDTAAAGGQEEYHARHILVKTKAEAEDVEKKLKKGGDFAKLAKEMSQDKSSGAAGGDLGWFTADKMVPEFSHAVAKMKKGEISQPVKSDFGWHVIQLEEVRKSTPPDFASVKEELKGEVGNKAIQDYVKGLMASVKVVSVDKDGKETDIPATAADAPPSKDITAAPAR